VCERARVSLSVSLCKTFWKTQEHIPKTIKTIMEKIFMYGLHFHYDVVLPFPYHKAMAIIRDSEKCFSTIAVECVLNKPLNKNLKEIPNSKRI
jgi:hypothetical protein